MSEEDKAQAPVPAEDSTAVAHKPKRWPIVISILAIFLAVFFVAFLHWHEEPTFCNAFCHQPMDRYVEGYYSEDDSMLVTAHREAGVTCLSCHWPQAKMLDLVHEVIYFATDQFTDPLPAHQYAVDGQDALVSDEFCGRCHDGVTAPTKESATEGMFGAYDPHNIPQDVAMHQTAGHDGGAITCGDCHTVHKGQTLICAECHSDAFNEETAPDGWIIPTDLKAQVAETYGPYDMHSIITTEAFQDVAMHQTAGADGGMITCTDCHKSDGEQNVLICAECHADDYANLIPEGWTVPDSEVSIDMKTAATADFGALDPHTLIYEDMFTSVAFHQTAGADGGMITCTDCHKSDGNNVFICSECHATSYETLVPDGWTVPESEIDIELPGAPTSDDEAASAESDDSASADESATTDDSADTADVTYTDGTYTASAKGISSDVSVTVTIEDGVVTDVAVDSSGETESIGAAAQDELAEQLLAAGSSDIDGVAGATVTSTAAKTAMDDALAQAAEA